MISIPSRFNGIDIPSDNPFANDKLGYQQYAPVLRDMVDMYKDSGCVLAVNGKWGTGKTTFMQMWRAALPLVKYSAIYFNAWETDYFSDPLTAILGELREISQDSETFKSVCAAIGKVTVAAGGAALKGLVKKATGVDADLVKDSIDAAKSIVQSNLDDYKEQKQSLTEFKKKLSEYVAGQDGKTVVFIIDELDRCNPHYAVRVLEIVKHLFDVPNICFILAIDKTQLECSIKGFYGSSEIDAANYLRRFIDIEFNLPKPAIKDFTALLYENYNFSEYFSNFQDCQKASSSSEALQTIAADLFEAFDIDLRTYDKVFAHTRLAVMQLGNSTILTEVVLVLCFIRITLPDLFLKLQEHKCSIQELVEKIEAVFPRSLLDESLDIHHSFNVHHMMYVIGPILSMYDNNGGYYSPGIFKNISDSSELPIHCSIMDKDKLKEAIVWFRRYGSSSVELDYAIKKVALLQQFN